MKTKKPQDLYVANLIWECSLDLSMDKAPESEIKTQNILPPETPKKLDHLKQPEAH